MDKIDKEYIAKAHRIFYDETKICISPAIDIALRKILKETREPLLKNLELTGKSVKFWAEKARKTKDKYKKELIKEIKKEIKGSIQNRDYQRDNTKNKINTEFWNGCLFGEDLILNLIKKNK